MTSDQQQLIFGTLLGNSKLIARDGFAQLVMKSNDCRWLELKCQELDELKGKYKKSYGNYYWYSNFNLDLYRIYNSFYHNGLKNITMDWLDQLRDIALAIWYGDCGALVGRTKTNACLRIQSLCGAEDIIVRYFNEVNMPCSINWVRHKPTVVFTKQGTITLFKIIGPYIPDIKYHLLF